MGSTVIQLLVLAAIAVFLIVRLANVLGNRDGFEKRTTTRSSDDEVTPVATTDPKTRGSSNSAEIHRHVPEGSTSAKALSRMSSAEAGFSIDEFLDGAKGAYEMILMAFENGDIDDIVPLLSDDVRDAFVDVIGEREDRGLSVDAQFVGIREVKLESAEYDGSTRLGELTVQFVAELTSVVKDANDKIIEGNPTEIKRQKDVWTFARKMGSSDPNWKLVATE